jgi:cytochrome c-type biogenesis protein CcmH/NrfG
MLERRLEHRPQDPTLWLALGNVAMERSDTAAAEEAYLRVLSLRPEDAEALNNLAWLYATSKEPSFRRPQEALRLAEMAARLAPSSPHILDTLAEAYFLNGRHLEAVEVERKALRLARENRDYYRRQLERFLRALSSSS